MSTSDALPTPVDGNSYEGQVLNKLEGAIIDGEAILKADPMYESIEHSIAYVMGDQLDPRRSPALSQVTDNRTKHIILQSVAALTDIHPLFGFKTFNDKFQNQNEVLWKLTQAWWVNNFCDVKLADVLRYAAVPGTGYCEVQWDPSAWNGEGDIVLIPRDPRDVLPYKPTLTGSVQSWEGVIVRSAKTIDELKARFPEKAYLIKPDRDQMMFSRTWTRARRIIQSLVTPAPADVLTATPQNAVKRVPTVDLHHWWLKDRRLHVGSEPIIMGDPGTSWSYKVYPVDMVGKPDPEDGHIIDKTECRIYPRGRLIIATRTAVLWDGPNPYWHGMFPIVKLCLDPWPWGLLGASLVKDIMPIQDATNELINGILDSCRKALRPGVIADRRAVPESQWRSIDTRLPGLKAKINAQLGKGIEFTEAPQLPQYVFEVLKMCISEMDYHADVANLQALTQLNQAPGADSVERLQEALSPVLRLKGRLMEAFLREVGEMVKYDFFQFYNMPRRVSILGEAGLDFADFDFDPGTMIPSMSQGDEGYDPIYDRRVDKSVRAQKHAKNFTFTITPNSLLAISQISRKLLYMQLWQGGLMDPWTLFEVLEIPNGGTPPNDAVTITDRLIAAQAVGLVGAVSAQGRKATNQQPPQQQQKGDGRVVTSTSG